MLGSLERELHLVLASRALKTEDDLLGGLCLLVEDWLGLTTETGLLPVVTTLTLSVDGVLALLVLGDLVWSVLAALLALAVGAACLWNVYHFFNAPDLHSKRSENWLDEVWEVR